MNEFQDEWNQISNDLGREISLPGKIQYLCSTTFGTDAREPSNASEYSRVFEFADYIPHDILSVLQNKSPVGRIFRYNSPPTSRNLGNVSSIKLSSNVRLIERTTDRNSYKRKTANEENIEETRKRLKGANKAKKKISQENGNSKKAETNIETDHAATIEWERVKLIMKNPRLFERNLRDQNYKKENESKREVEIKKKSLSIKKVTPIMSQVSEYTLNGSSILMNLLSTKTHNVHTLYESIKKQQQQTNETKKMIVDENPKHIELAQTSPFHKVSSALNQQKSTIHTNPLKSTIQSVPILQETIEEKQQQPNETENMNLSVDDNRNVHIGSAQTNPSKVSTALHQVDHGKDVKGKNVRRKSRVHREILKLCGLNYEKHTIIDNNKRPRLRPPLIRPT